MNTAFVTLLTTDNGAPNATCALDSLLDTVGIDSHKRTFSVRYTSGHIREWKWTGGVTQDEAVMIKLLIDHRHTTCHVSYIPDELKDKYRT